MATQQASALVAKSSKVFRKVFDTLTGADTEKDVSAAENSAPTDDSSQKSDNNGQPGGSYLHRTLTRRKGSTYKAIINELHNTSSEQLSTDAVLGSPDPKGSSSHAGPASESSTTPSPQKSSHAGGTPTKSATERGRRSRGRSRNRLSKHTLPLRFGSMRRSRSVQAAISAVLLNASEIPIPSSPVPVPGPPPKHCERLDFGGEFGSVLRGEMERMGFSAEPEDDEPGDLDGAKACGEDAMTSTLPTPPEPRIFPMDDLLKGDVDAKRCESLLGLGKLGVWENNVRWAEESRDTMKVKKEEVEDGRLGDDNPTKPKPPASTPVPGTPPPKQDHGCQTVQVPATPRTPPPPSNVEAAWTNFMGGFVGVLAVAVTEERRGSSEEFEFGGMKVERESSSSPPECVRNAEDRESQKSLLEQELHDTIHSIITLDEAEDSQRHVEVQSERSGFKCPECLHCSKYAKHLGIGDGDEECQPLLPLFSQSASSSSEENLKSIRTKLALRSSDESSSAYEDESFSKATTPTFTADVTKSVTVTCSSESDSADSVPEAYRLWFPVPDSGKMLVHETAREWGVIPFDARKVAADVEQSADESLENEWTCVDGRGQTLGAATGVLEGMEMDGGIRVRGDEKIHGSMMETSHDMEEANGEDGGEIDAGCRQPAEEWYQFRIWRQNDETN